MSWDAGGRLDAIYASMGVSNGRDELARRSGVDPNTLSGINGSKRPMTLKMARRILAAAPRFTLLDLGAPAGIVTDEEDLRVVDRLQSLEVELEGWKGLVLEALALLDLQAHPEADPGSRVRRSTDGGRQASGGTSR